MLLNGIRQAPIKTSTDSGFVLAKLRDHSLLTLLHNEEACAHPDQQQSAQDHTNTQIPEDRGNAIGRCAVGWTFVGWSAIFATQELRQLAIQITPKFVQIRGARLGARFVGR